MGTDPGLRRLALGTLLGALPGHTPPPWATDLLDAGLAGYTLFGRNVESPGQLAAACATLRQARPDVLLAIDEEGGDVTRLAHATGSPYPGNAALGAVDDPDLTRRIYRSIGYDLAATGVNLDLAPTVDVNTADDNPIIGTRSFGADPALVSRHSVAAVAGLQEAGIAACAKHFPGHGATLTDSHLDLPTVAAPLNVLRQRDLPPFAAVVKAGVRSIMTAHIRVPTLTGAGPATFSRSALVGLLRVEFGFTGAVISDALEMKGAAVAAGGIGPAAVWALAAGVDLLCVGADVDDALIDQVATAIVDAIGHELPRARLEQAAARTAELAEWTRAASASASTSVTAGVAACATAGMADAGPDADGSELGLHAARRAVRVEGWPDGFSAALVVRIGSSSTIAEGRVPWGLAAHLRDGDDQLSVVATETSPEQLIEAARGRPIVLVGRHLHRNPAARELTELLTERHSVAVVEMGWPSSWRPAGARAFIITYGASLASGRAAAEVIGLSPADRSRTRTR